MKQNVRGERAYFSQVLSKLGSMFSVSFGGGGVDGKRECISREQTIIAIHFILFGLAKE